jgi:hypothetical protein
MLVVRGEVEQRLITRQEIAPTRCLADANTFFNSIAVLTLSAF